MNAFLRANLILSAMLLALGAHATEVTDQTACILKVAETLPKVAGLRIEKGTAMPAAGAPEGVFRVTVDWSAAGQSTRWVYLCVVAANGDARVQRLKE